MLKEEIAKENAKNEPPKSYLSFQAGQPFEAGSGSSDSYYGITDLTIDSDNHTGYASTGLNVDLLVGASPVVSSVVSFDTKTHIPVDLVPQSSAKKLNNSFSVAVDPSNKTLWVGVSPEDTVPGLPNSFVPIDLASKAVGGRLIASDTQNPENKGEAVLGLVINDATHTGYAVKVGPEIFSFDTVWSDVPKTSGILTTNSLLDGYVGVVSIALDRAANRAYTALYPGPRNPISIIVPVDLNGGKMTPMDPVCEFQTADEIFKMAIDPANSVLYASDGSQLFSINLTTKTHTPIPVPNVAQIKNLAVDEALHVLYVSCYTDEGDTASVLMYDTRTSTILGQPISIQVPRQDVEYEPTLPIAIDTSTNIVYIGSFLISGEEDSITTGIITPIVPQAAPVQITSPLGSVPQGPSVTISGTGAPGATVRGKLVSQSSAVVWKNIPPTVVDEEGKWSATVHAATGQLVPLGRMSVTVGQQFANLAPSNTSFSFTVIPATE